MEVSQAYDILFDIVANESRHEHYEKTLQVKKFAKQIVTGEGQEDIVNDFRKGESDNLKKQRNRLTNTLTKYVISRPRKYWKKISRVEGINVVFKANDQERLNDLKTMFFDFYEGRDLIGYLNYKLEFLGVTDPNAWIIYERYDTRDAEGNIIKTKVYPFIVGCEDVIMYHEEFGELKYLVVRQSKIDKQSKGGDAVVYDFYLYAPGITIRARQAGESVNNIQLEDEGSITIEMNTTKKPVKLYVSAKETGTNRVPAKSVSAYQDEKTNQKTGVTWFDPAEHVFRDLIRDKSFLDVTKTSHAFPKRWEYVRPCSYESSEHGKCERGFMSIKHDMKCPACMGSGKSPTFTTEQQVLQLSLPKGDTSSLLELSKLSFYEQLPIELPKWLDEQVEKAEKRVMNAVFNGGVIDKAVFNTEKTATQVNYEYEDIYDVLAPFADLISQHFELAYYVGADYYELTGFDVDHRFPKDFKMKTLNDLIEEFDKLKKSGAGYDALRNVRKSIIEKQNEDNPQTIAAILARYDFLPFDDKAEDEVTMILAARSPVDDQRVLRENWLEIFVEIENENIITPFYLMTYEKKKEVVKAKVEQFKSRIVLAGGAEEFPNLDEGGDADDDNIETPDAQ